MITLVKAGVATMVLVFVATGAYDAGTWARADAPKQMVMASTALANRSATRFIEISSSFSIVRGRKTSVFPSFASVAVESNRWSNFCSGSLPYVTGPAEALDEKTFVDLTALPARRPSVGIEIDMSIRLVRQLHVRIELLVRSASSSCLPAPPNGRSGGKPWCVNFCL